MHKKAGVRDEAGSIRSPGAGVIGICDLLHADTGNKLRYPKTICSNSEPSL